MPPLNRQNILIGLAIIIALGSAYYYFAPGGDQTPLTATPQASHAEQQFLDLAARLNSVSFDTSIFTDPRFTQLVDLATEVTPEAKGRIDPFSPLGK